MRTANKVARQKTSVSSSGEIKKPLSGVSSWENFPFLKALPDKTRGRDDDLNFVRKFIEAFCDSQEEKSASNLPGRKSKAAH